MMLGRSAVEIECQSGVLSNWGVHGFISRFVAPYGPGPSLNAILGEGTTYCPF